MTFNFTADLACYSLACNSNVPATPLDLNHYYTYRRGTASSTTLVATSTSTSTPPQTSAFLASTSVANPSLSDSKAAAVAATTTTTTAAAAAVSSVPLVPSNNGGRTSIPRKLSKLDLLIQTATELHAPSSTSLPTPTLTQQPTSFDILCSHAHKELQSATTSSTTATSSTTTTTTTSTLTPESRPKKNSKRRRDDSNNTSNTAANLAIKLASPSTTTKRQRSGPSCDCCRARKIKCDSEIFILSTLDSDLHNNDVSTKEANSYIAHCEFIVSSNKTGYQYYKIIKDQEHSLNNKLTSFNYLQFKPCKACTVKNLKCCFSKGFTRNDIIKFNKSEREINPPQIPTPTNTPTPTNSVSQIKQSQVSSQVLSQVSSQSNQQPALPTPSPTPAESSPLNSDDDDRKTKKTSCKTCRFKKIKCVKVGKGCMYCSKKGVPCIYT